MGNDIWSGKEHFLRDSAQENKISKVKKNYAKVVIAVLIIASVIFVSNQLFSEEVTITGDVIYGPDELEEYRNMTAAELLRLLNEEAGFEESHPLVELEMEAGMYYFEPREIVVTENDSVKIDIKAIDVDHNIVIPRFYVSKDLPAGEHTTIAFIATRPGSFVFYNKYNKNMAGKVTVLEKSPEE